MQIALITIMIVLLAAVLAVLLWLISASFAARREIAQQGKVAELLTGQLEALKAAQDATKETLAKSLQTGQQSLNQNLQSSMKTLTDLNKQIGELQGTNKQMLTLGTDLKRLQNILSSPKLRGQMGEWSLENLLKTILPGEAFILQYGFRDNQKVDALVKLADFAVPIDAKFPLPAFERMTHAEDDGQKTRERKQFIRDVINHIDKIAANYIRPAEGTLDFAMMYIPAENVYYETIVTQDGDSKNILEYALDKRVIPVSPNLLYAYLMTVVMGLHGLQIEQQAADIRRNLTCLNAGFVDFAQTWDLVGKHLRNTYSQYETGQKKLDRFGMQLEQVQGEQLKSSPQDLDLD